MAIKLEVLRNDGTLFPYGKFLVELAERIAYGTGASLQEAEKMSNTVAFYLAVHKTEEEALSCFSLSVLDRGTRKWLHSLTFHRYY
jgi:hypothetical protein